MLRLFCALAFLMVIAPAFARHGTQYANTGSSLGMNLSEITPGTASQPFLNAWKTAGGWFTLNSGSEVAEEAYLYTNCLDANGYPITLSTTVGSCSSGGHTFNSVSSQAMTNQTNYAGTWIWDYDNTGTFTVSKDASAYTSCPITGHPNRHLLTSAAAGAGISITETATGSGSSYAQNFRLVYAPTSTCGNGTTATQDPREISLYSGEIFNPDFIARTKPFRLVRFMDWMETNNSTQGNWANRPPQGWVFWDEGQQSTAQASGTPYSGVPAETMFQLCIEIHADCWFNMPHAADNTYVTNFATLAHTTLANTSTLVYVEYSNEVWNSTFGQHTYVGNQAQTDFGANWNEGGYNWQGMRQAQFGNLWKAAWGSDSGRVKTLIGVQGADPDTAGVTFSNELLTTPLWTGTGVKLQFTGSISNGSGGAGTVLNISSIASGSPAVGSPVRGINADVDLTTKITACPGGTCGGTGNYTVNFSQNVASETMIGGGGASPGGPAQPSLDILVGAPYWGYDPPSSWPSSADGGTGQFFTEALKGGLMPTGSAFCTTGGTSTAITLSSNTGNCASSGSVTCPPADQTIITAKFGTVPGSAPKIAVDGCATVIPLQQGCIASQGSCSAAGLEDPAVTGTIGTNSIWNITYAAGLGANGTWILAQLGYAGGMLKQMNDVEAVWSAYTAGLSPPIPYMSYEGGQGLNGNNSLIFSLNTAVQTDPRMYQAYSQYVATWEANGGQVFNHFNDIGAFGTFGFWSALQKDVTQTTSPKYSALLDFIRRNPCWWSGCRH